MKGSKLLDRVCFLKSNSVLYMSWLWLFMLIPSLSCQANLQQDPIQLNCYANVISLRANHARFYVNCGLCKVSQCYVWGFKKYRYRSSICCVGIHYGAITPSGGVMQVFTYNDGVPEFRSLFQNGIRSHSYPYSSSQYFTVEAVHTAITVQPTTDASLTTKASKLSVQTTRSLESTAAVISLKSPTTEPISAQTPKSTKSVTNTTLLSLSHAVLKSEGHDIIQSNCAVNIYNIGTHRDNFLVNCVQCQIRRCYIWGSKKYRFQSSVCCAGIHHNAIPQSGGVMQVYIHNDGVPGFLSSFQNGINSRSYPYAMSQYFTVEGIQNETLKNLQKASGRLPATNKSEKESQLPKQVIAAAITSGAIATLKPTSTVTTMLKWWQMSSTILGLVNSTSSAISILRSAISDLTDLMG